MKKPAPLRFLLGNNLACLASMSVTFVVAYGWYGGDLHVSWMMPAFCVGFTAGCLKARGEVRQFRAWERDWNAMAGVPTTAPRLRIKKLPLVWVLWVFLLLVGIAQPFASESDKQGYALAFIASTIWALVDLFRRIKRRQRSSGRVQSEEHIVSQCLPVPRRSPGIDEIRSALPSYCHTLLNRPRKSSP